MDKYFDGELLSGFEESPKTTTSRYEQLGYCEYRDVKTGLVASNYIEVMNQQFNRIADLEAKLAKSDMEVFMLTKNNDCYKSDIAQLKQQLAEKDKEIAYFKKQAKKFNNEAQKYFEDAYCNGFQNQTAIEELEKVKEWFKRNAINNSNNNVVLTDHSCIGVLGLIDRQIDELRLKNH